MCQSFRALALGVAVEGIVKHLFPEAGTLIAGMREIVPHLEAHCLAWREMPAGELGDSLRRRLPGMLGQLLNMSTKDKLQALAQEKVIDQAHIKAWNELRNTSAHGVTPGSKSLQKLIDLCNKVTVMMYRLIFRGCGYVGRYEDYATRNFPTRFFRGQPITEEEKAVAAYFLSEKNLYQDDVARWYAGMAELQQRFDEGV